jgi:hypothetical protein
MRHRFAVLLLLAFVLRAEVVITPSKQVTVTAGSTIQFKANMPVTWSLLPGSAGSIDANGRYHAPANIPVKDNLAGCQLLPNDHILNTRIDALPPHPKSAEWLARMPAARLIISPSWGINIADNATPSQAMHFLYTPANDATFQIPLWPELKRENGVFSDPLGEVDRHVVTINRENCMLYELYNNYEAGVNKKCPSCKAQSGVAYSGMSYHLPASATDAAGLYLAPLTLRLDEIQAGAIQHALRFTLRNNFISPTSAWPALSHAGAWGFIPYGTRFRLKASFDISRFSPAAQVVLKQMREYGLIVADGGADWDIQASTDVMEDYGVRSALAEISQKGPRSTDFEAVEESALMVSQSSGRVNPRNAFVKPDSFAVVLATSLKNPNNTAEAAIALQGVTVGVPDPAIWIQSGVQKKLAAWVTGTENKAVQWKLNPPLGEISAAGVYTTPSVKRPTATVITASSLADPNAKTAIAVTVMPPGDIRIDVGSATSAPGAPNKQAPDYGPDAEGHMWWRDQASESAGGATIDSWYGEDWPRKPDIGLYYTSRYALGDMNYQFFVPNGNYKISLMMAQPDCKNTFNPKWRAPIHLEAQGQMILRDFDLGDSINYACLTPVVESLPASVSDNRLYFSLRSEVSKDRLASPLLNAFVISPDADAPHLAIVPGVNTLTTGQQTQFYAIRWFTSGDVKWSLSGPGSLSPTGLYTAPSAPPKKEEIVRVEAKTLSNPTVSAVSTFKLEAGELVLSPSKEVLVRSLSKQFKATFGSVPYSNLQWSVTPALGTVSASGLYTAPDSLSSDAQVTIRAESKDDPGKSASATVILKASPGPIRIDCGGLGPLTDGQGNVWSADYGFSGDTVTYLNRVHITGAPSGQEALYQSSRYRYQDQPFYYRFAVPNGRYAVTLKFADYSFDTPGHYSFDVALNGQKVLTNFDPDIVHGAKSAVDKEFQVTVSNKEIKIDFIGHKDAAFINAIQIVYLAPS